MPAGMTGKGQFTRGGRGSGSRAGRGRTLAAEMLKK